MREAQIQVDLYHFRPQTVPLKQGDDTVLYVTVLTDNAPLDLTPLTVALDIRLSDGLIIIQDSMTAEGNVLTVNVHEYAVAQTGELMCELRFYRDGKRISSYKFTAEVSPALLSEGTVPPAVGDIIIEALETLAGAAGELSDTLDEAKAVRDDVNAAKSAAETAAQNALGSESAAENAKTAAETAASAAQTSRTLAEAAKGISVTMSESAVSSAVDAHNASEAAQTASAVAESAKTAALSAKADAETASAASQFSALTAQEARSAAQSAKEAAQGANTAAQDAKTTAENAKNVAVSSAEKAVLANEEAQGAKTAAQTAESGAAISAATAQSARNEAQAAQNGAETAQTEAEAAAAEAHDTLANKAERRDTSPALTATTGIAQSHTIADISPTWQGLRGLTMYGNTPQSVAPMPEAPIPLVGVVDPAVTVDTTSAALAGITLNGVNAIKDTVDITDSTVTLTRRAQIRTLTGAESWVLQGDNANGIISFSFQISNENATPAVAIESKSSHLIREATGISTISNRSHFVQRSTTTVLYIRLYKADIPDLAAYKAWLAAQYAHGTPLTVVYALAVPAVTDITDTPSGQALLALRGTYPTTEVTCDADCEVKYNRDINKAIQNLTNAILAMGGNI